MRAVAWHPFFLIILPMTTQLKEVKRLYRLYMNGVVSQSMRQNGATYRVNFGLTMPLLRRVAEMIPHTVEMAEELWRDTGVRESMLLAPMVYPKEFFSRELAQQWVREMPNVEVADYCCKFLFSHLPEAATLSCEWVTAEESLVAYAGYRLAYSLLDTVEKPEWVREIAMCALPCACEGGGAMAQCARQWLVEGLQRGVAGAVIVACLDELSALPSDWKTSLRSLYEESR